MVLLLVVTSPSCSSASCHPVNQGIPFVKAIPGYLEDMRQVQSLDPPEWMQITLNRLADDRRQGTCESSISLALVLGFLQGVLGFIGIAAAACS